MAIGDFTTSKKVKKSSTNRSGNLAFRKYFRIVSSSAFDNAIWYKLLVSINSSNTSVQSTTVLGMATRAFSNSSNSGWRFTILSINASPRPFPPKEPSPIRAKLEYRSKRSRLNTATTPWFFILRYFTIASKMIFRWASTSWRLFHVIGFKNSATGNIARE